MAVYMAVYALYARIYVVGYPQLRGKNDHKDVPKRKKEEEEIFVLFNSASL